MLVAFVIVSFVTGKMGGTAMKYHEWSGLAILVLVLFRILWGFVGGNESRFKSFVKGPSAVYDYTRTMFQKDSERHLGHNPLGGWSVLLLLISLLVQAGTGLFANDDILTEGPLFDLVSKDTSDWLTSIHHINKIILAGLISIHMGAILFYLIYKRENLIYPMISGFKDWHQNVQPHIGKVWLAAGIFAVIAAIAFMIV
jgi:cytochrome b